MSTPKPIEYVVEFYHSSFINDPTFAVTTSTPLMAMSVGDYLYLGSWGNEENMYGQITKLRHNIYDVAKEHVTHQIGVVFDYVEKDAVHE